MGVIDWNNLDGGDEAEEQFMDSIHDCYNSLSMLTSLLVKILSWIQSVMGQITIGLISNQSHESPAGKDFKSKLQVTS